MYQWNAKTCNMKFKNKIIVSVVITLITMTLLIIMPLRQNTDDSSDGFKLQNIRRKLLLPKYRESSSYLYDNSSDHLLETDIQPNNAPDSLVKNEKGEKMPKSSKVDMLFSILSDMDGFAFDFDSLSDKEYSYLQFLEEQKKYIKNGPHLDSVQSRYGRAVYYAKSHKKPVASWTQFHLGIQKFAMYDPSAPYIQQLLKNIATLPIREVSIKEKGTQVKLTIRFLDGGTALFKPMRFPREQETLTNHFYFNDYERHNAEIAAFHLDRLLGFYRVPPHTGRIVHVTDDIKHKSDTHFARTFYKSPANNTCFFGNCKYYCDSNHPVCGNPEMLEGSFGAFLPPDDIAPRERFRNPWRRSYSKYKKAEWEGNNTYCNHLKTDEIYGVGNRLINLIDTHIFDFLMGNLDRHHYETFEGFGQNTFLVHLDHGRGFGRAGEDYMDILAPLYQCCMIKYSTFITLAKLYLGPDLLSDLMRTSLESDPLNPILTEPHLLALDRRVTKILETVNNCILKTKRYTEVIINDR